MDTSPFLTVSWNCSIAEALFVVKTVAAESTTEVAVDSNAIMTKTATRNEAAILLPKLGLLLSGSDRKTPTWF